MFETRRLNLLLLKNTIMALLPAVVILLIIIASMAHYNLLGNLEFHQIKNLEDLDAAYYDNIENVQITFQEIDNMGYDYTLNGKKAGSYYYAFLDGKCVILLVDSDEARLYDYTVKGQLKQDNTMYNYLLGQCADAVGFSLDQMKSVTYRFVISEVDYPRVFYGIVKTAFYLAVLIVVFSIVEGLVCIAFPWLHPQMRKLKGVSSRRLIAGDINRQIHDAVRFDRGNVIVTKKYLIISTWMYTDIIILKEIEVISKHKERKKVFLGEKTVFKLIISNSRDMFYEHEFKNEDILDEMIPLIKRKRPLPVKKAVIITNKTES